MLASAHNELLDACNDALYDLQQKLQELPWINIPTPAQVFDCIAVLGNEVEYMLANMPWHLACVFSVKGLRFCRMGPISGVFISFMARRPERGYSIHAFIGTAPEYTVDINASGACGWPATATAYSEDYITQRTSREQWLKTLIEDVMGLA